MAAHHIVPYFTQSYLDAVSAAAVDMFRGKAVRRIEELLTEHRGTPVQDSFQEIFIRSVRTFHFMKLLPEEDVLVVLVTRDSTNQGMGWVSTAPGGEADHRRGLEAWPHGFRGPTAAVDIVVVGPGSSLGQEEITRVVRLSKLQRVA